MSAVGRPLKRRNGPAALAYDQFLVCSDRRTALSGLVGALAELGSVRLDDNFTVPTAVGLAVTLSTLG